MKIIAKNKKAFHDYDVLSKLEAGIVLRGDEVKSLRQGGLSLSGSYAVFNQTELFLLNSNISAYSHAYQASEVDPTRTRKLLLHKKELNKLIGEVSSKGVTLIPLSLYFNERGKVKVELGVCRHKKAQGKKEALKERDIRKQTAREIKSVYKYR